MSNYSKTTNFAVKDGLAPGDPAKVITGTAHDTEYNNIATAVATKTDNSAAAITGGTINGTTIGNVSTAAGSFTTVGGTTITATVSVVTPLVGTTTATNLGLQYNASTEWVINTTGLVPSSDNTRGIGNATNRVAVVTTPIVDSGTAASLFLKTLAGQTQLELLGSTATNWMQVAGSTTSPTMRTTGGSADVSLTIQTKGAGGFAFSSDAFGSAPTQFEILHTASATRRITVTGSNGGNPTINTTGGSLAITPAIVAASTLSVTGGIVPNFTSAETAVPSGTATTTSAHGLSTVPSYFSIILRNKTTEFGYAVGDEMDMSTGDNGSPAIWADTTNVGIRQISTPTIARRDVASFAAITPGNWKYVFKAWK